MSRQQSDMIRQAQETYRQIYPCGTKARFEDCFTIMNDKYVFWFNTADNSTHVIVTDSASEK